MYSLQTSVQGACPVVSTLSVFKTTCRLAAFDEEVPPSTAPIASILGTDGTVVDV